MWDQKVVSVFRKTPNFRYLVASRIPFFYWQRPRYRNVNPSGIDLWTVKKITCMPQPTRYPKIKILTIFCCRISVTDLNQLRILLHSYPCLTERAQVRSLIFAFTSVCMRIPTYFFKIFPRPILFSAVSAISKYLSDFFPHQFIPPFSRQHFIFTLSRY